MATFLFKPNLSFDFKACYQDVYFNFCKRKKGDKEGEEFKKSVHILKILQLCWKVLKK